MPSLIVVVKPNRGQHHGPTVVIEAGVSFFDMIVNEIAVGTVRRTQIFIHRQECHDVRHQKSPAGIMRLIE
jgi:hypothetical protein